MAYELDHLFICTDIDAPVGDLLVSFGLTEGSSNVHHGQGTANRRFFFHNAMLELLWVNDPTEAQSALIRPTRLWERWAARPGGLCPFGFAARPAGGENLPPPFPVWDYRPPYLPAGQSIPVATNSGQLAEPMLFYLPGSLPPENYPANRRQPLAHACGFAQITRVTLFGPCAGQTSPQMQGAIQRGVFTLRSGPDYLLELGFDGEKQHQQRCFAPSLPLAFSW